MTTEATFRDNLFGGRTVLVTGGTSGIGAATAARFVESGAEVHVIGLDARGPGVPSGVSVTELDVTDTAALADVIGCLDRLDVLVNCAGVSRDRQEYEVGVFAEVLAVNLTAAMAATQAARPLLSGCVVNIASMYSFFGAADRPAYSASKGGIVQLTKSLAVEYGPAGVRVNAVAPGWIDTPLSKGLQADPVAGPAVLGRLPAGDWGVPEHVAGVVLFLASPAAAYINGAILPVDGGYLAA